MKPRTAIGLVLLLASSACAGTTEIPPPPPDEVHPPGEGVALDDGRREIAGRLLAHDGTPLRHAELIVRREGFREAKATEVLDDDGSFRVSVPSGVYSVVIAAVDHRMVLRSTVVTDDLRVEGRLGTYARTDPGQTLGIRSEYLDAEGTVVAPGPGAAARVTEGVYRLELPSKPPGATRLRYQLVAAGGGRTYNGPLADEYQSDGGGDFWSIVDVSTKDALELDLGALPPADLRPQLEWTGESEPTVALHDYQDRWYGAIDELRGRIPRKDGKILEMTEELQAEATALAAKAREEIDAVADPTTQALLRMFHLSMFGAFLGTMRDAKAMREEVAWILDHLSPTDPHIALLLNLDNFLYSARRDADEAFVARSDAWLERRAREHAEPSLAIDALEILMGAANDRHDEARLAELYAVVVDERFDGTFAQARLKQRYDPDRILQRGKPFPAFDFAALRDADGRVTSTDRAGTLYLIEFWATWCGPCVAEMPKLHATYAAINGAKPGKGRGDEGMRRLLPAKHPKIEFVFVSLDAAPGEVEAFRKEHWSMPWAHGFVGQTGEKDAMQRYGFSGVPTAVLVDETGTILEVNGPLRGVELQPTLERVLAERGRS